LKPLLKAKLPKDPLNILDWLRKLQAVVTIGVHFVVLQMEIRKFESATNQQLSQEECQKLDD